MDTINITSQLIHCLRMGVKKIDSWLLQLPILLIAIGSLNPAADFTSNDWTYSTFNVIFMVSVSVPYKRGCGHQIWNFVLASVIKMNLFLIAVPYRETITTLGKNTTQFQNLPMVRH
jgi:hypothetical protein